MDRRTAVLPTDGKAELRMKTSRLVVSEWMPDCQRTAVLPTDGMAELRLKTSRLVACEWKWGTSMDSDTIYERRHCSSRDILTLARSGATPNVIGASKL